MAGSYNTSTERALPAAGCNPFARFVRQRAGGLAARACLCS
jgi:hypothetical protein